MKYKAILFDVDDTLLDSMAARVATLERVFKSAGIAHDDPEQFLRDLHGNSLEAVLTQLARDRGIDADLFDEYRRIYWNRESSMLTLYPGVKDALEKLSGLGLKLGIVTTKYADVEFEGKTVGAAGELEELGIADFFSIVVGFEHVSLPKPHPHGINLALNHLRTMPVETLMVGDSAADIQAAKAAGCWGCHATWGLPPKERTNLLGSTIPDFILDSPGELLKLVK